MSANDRFIRFHESMCARGSGRAALAACGGRKIEKKKNAP